MSDAISIADIAAFEESKKRSDAEDEFEQVGAALLEDEFRQPVAVMLFNRLRFAVPGGWYTPDFNVILQDGRTAMIEVKGSKHQKNYRDARSKLRAAAALYPYWTWLEARRERRGAWVLEQIEEEWQ